MSNVKRVSPIKISNKQFIEKVKNRNLSETTVNDNDNIFVDGWTEITSPTKIVFRALFKR